MQREGHPVAGAVCGALFFFFIGLTMMLFNVIPLSGPWLAFPLVGLVVGGIWGALAPLGRKRPKVVGFTPIVPLGEPTGRNWTVRPATGEVPVVQHENALGLQPMPVDLEGGSPAADATAVHPGVAGAAEPASPWAPDAPVAAEPTTSTPVVSEPVVSEPPGEHPAVGAGPPGSEPDPEPGPDDTTIVPREPPPPPHER